VAAVAAGAAGAVAVAMVPAATMVVLKLT